MSTEDRLAAWARQYGGPVELTHAADEVIDLAVVPEEDRLSIGDAPVLMSLDQAADVLGLPTRAAWQLYRMGRFPVEVVKGGRVAPFSVWRDDLQQWMRAHPKGIESKADVPEMGKDGGRRP